MSTFSISKLLLLENSHNIEIEGMILRNVPPLIGCVNLGKLFTFSIVLSSRIARRVKSDNTCKSLNARLISKIANKY